MSSVTLSDLVSVLADAGIVVEDATAAKPARKPTRAKQSGRKPASARASAARKPAGKESYVPTDDRRGGMPTGRMLWALNAAGLLTLRKSPGSPLTFGACWDARAGIES